MAKDEDEKRDDYFRVLSIEPSPKSSHTFKLKMNIRVWKEALEITSLQFVVTTA
jgi:hypothetical protein